MFNLKRKGVVPNGGVLLKTFGARKTLALYQTKLSGIWLSLKLILVVGAAPKGNYVMYWNGLTLGGTDYIILSEHQPEIAAEIVLYLKENFPVISGLVEQKGSSRTSEGVAPDGGSFLGTVPGIDGVDWNVYSVTKSSPNTGVELVATGSLVGRANYSLDWDGRRFIRDKNFQRLAERIELLGAAEEFVEAHASRLVAPPEEGSARPPALALFEGMPENESDFYYSSSSFY